MKPAPFDYFTPATLDEALALLAEHGADAKPLAGGQSLIPAMNFRLARPAALVDLNRIGELSYIRSERDGRGGGATAIGAMTRQRAVERSEEVARVTFLSVGDGPVLATEAGKTLAGQTPSEELLRAAADAAATRDADPPSDIHASAAYRRQLVAVLTRRALARAFERAGKNAT